MLLLLVDGGVLGDEEGGAQVVLGSRVLVESANQVGDRRSEVVTTNDRRVEQHRLAAFDEGERLGVGHALKHLDVELTGDAARLCQFQRPGDVKEIVTRYAYAQSVGVLGAKHDVEESTEAGVDVGLRGVGRSGPTVQFGLDVFHREVRALHQSDLYLTGAPTLSISRKGDEFFERGVRIRQVGLKHESGAESVERRFLEDSGERVQREAEVSVLFHVEIDEGVGRLGLAVEDAKFRGHSLE